MSRISSSDPRVTPLTRPQTPEPPAQPAPQPAEAQRLQLHTRDTFEPAGNPGLDAINRLQLTAGPDYTCVTTVRANLRRAGLEGLPPSTSRDNNNARGMMVQMLQSGHWDSMPISGATQQTITSPYGSVQAQVLSGPAYMAAARNGQIPEGSVVFQTQHREGWAYGAGQNGNDVGIVRNGGIFNYRQFDSMSVYGRNGENLTGVVVLQPSTR